MKPFVALTAVAAVTTLISCGPSAEELAAHLAFLKQITEPMWLKA